MAKRKKQTALGLVGGFLHEYNYPLYMGFSTDYSGFLPGGENLKASSACWRFCGLAIRVVIDVPSQITKVGDSDTTVRIRDIAEGVRVQYGFESLEEFMRFHPECRMEAFRQARPWPHEFQSWLDSGGRNQNELTRDPDKLD